VFELMHGMQKGWLILPLSQFSYKTENG